MSWILWTSRLILTLSLLFAVISSEARLQDSSKENRRATLEVMRKNKPADHARSFLSLSHSDFLRLSPKAKITYIETLQKMATDLELSKDTRFQSSLFFWLNSSYAEEAVSGSLCLFAGTFQNAKTEGARQFCPKPPQGICGEGEAQCEKLVFGDGVCAKPPFSNASKQCRMNAKSSSEIATYISQHPEEWNSYQQKLSSYCGNPLAFNAQICTVVQKQTKTLLAQLPAAEQALRPEKDPRTVPVRQEKPDEPQPKTAVAPVVQELTNPGSNSQFKKFPLMEDCSTRTMDDNSGVIEVRLQGGKSIFVAQDKPLPAELKGADFTAANIRAFIEKNRAQIDTSRKVSERFKSLAPMSVSWMASDHIGRSGETFQTKELQETYQKFSARMKELGIKDEKTVEDYYLGAFGPFYYSFAKGDLTYLQKLRPYSTLAYAQQKKKDDPSAALNQAKSESEFRALLSNLRVIAENHPGDAFKEWNLFSGLISAHAEALTSKTTPPPIDPTQKKKILEANRNSHKEVQSYISQVFQAMEGKSSTAVESSITENNDSDDDIASTLFNRPRSGYVHFANKDHEGVITKLVELCEKKRTEGGKPKGSNSSSKNTQ